jgi:hypothetical protein
MEKEAMDIEVRCLLCLLSLCLSLPSSSHFFHKKIIDTVTFLGSKRNWKGEYLPFCGDENSLLLIDTSTGKVYEWDADDGLGDEVARSFSAYLEAYRNSLLEGHMEFLSGVGVVENMSGAPSRK